MHGPRKSKLVKANQGTGWESRWMTEVARATGSLKRSEVNDVVKYILSKFKDSISKETAPEGYSFEELYNPGTCEIKTEYLQKYYKVKQDLESWGLRF